MSRSALVLSCVALTAAALLAGCGSDYGGTDAAASTQTPLAPAYTRLPSTAAATECGPDSGKTVADGKLTVATDRPAYPPWFVDGDPGNGKGFEGAVAQAVWERMGYTRDDVEFVTVGFNDALEPGPKSFDFDINQFTIVDDRRGDVDFSSPYYAVAQSVIAMSTNPASRAQTLAALSGYRLGAATGSTSLAAIQASIQPRTTAVEFATNDEAKAALADGTIDALVVDIPTGLQIAGDQIPGSVLVGQFPRPNDVTEFFGLLLEKNSPLTLCASAAVDALYADGTLDRLAEQWITSTAGVRVLA